MATLADAINQARQTFPEMSSTRALGYASIVHRRLLKVLNIRENSTTISLTTGTGDYDLPVDVAGIFAVVYYQSSTAYSALSLTSFEDQDMIYPEWRADTSTGTPSKYLIRSTKSTDPSDKFTLTLLPTPNTTTGTGYPILKIWYVDHADVTGLDAVLPGTLLDDRVYVNGIRALYCEDNALEKTGFYQSAYEADLNRCIQAFRDMTVNEDGPRVVRPFFRGRGVV